MNRKEIAIDFLKLAGLGEVNAAFNKYVSEEFIHHNQYFEGSKDALLKAMKDAHDTNRNKSIDIKQCFEDQNTVITHSLVCKADLDIAVVHIFKFNSENKITELWDLGQIIDKDSPNTNGLL